MASKSNLSIDQGTDVSIDIGLIIETGIDLTDGYTCRASMRRHYQSNNSHSFTCSIVDSNTINLSLTNSQSSNVGPGRYVYDVELVSAANLVTRAVEGMVTVYPEVTK